MEWLADAGFGLDHAALSLVRTTAAQVAAGARLRDEIDELLRGAVVEVEHIGSSSVEGLLAKPIVDLAAGSSSIDDLAEVRVRLEGAGWIYRGDAGSQGGHVFVLESLPTRRVAHLHVVEHLGIQWQNYLSLRNLLRRSHEARDRYEATKLRLLDEVAGDRVAYTDGKTDVVRSLLEGT